MWYNWFIISVYETTNANEPHYISYIQKQRDKGVIIIAQMDGYTSNTLNRVAIEVITRTDDGSRIDRDDFYYFQVNPDSLVYTYPQRSLAYKTRSSNVIEDFQSGVGTINMEGTTGFKSGTGIQRMKELADALHAYADSGYTTEKDRSFANKAELRFWNFTDDLYHQVAIAPNGYSIERSVQSPLTARYKIQFYIVRSLNDPDYRSIDQPTLGNRFDPNATTTQTINPSYVTGNSAQPGQGSDYPDTGIYGGTNNGDGGDENNNDVQNPNDNNPRGERTGRNILRNVLNFFNHTNYPVT